MSAVRDGKIVFADWFRNFGLLVIIEHQNNFLSLYGHNKKLLKAAGNFVKTGETVMVDPRSEAIIVDVDDKQYIMISEHQLLGKW